MAQRKAVYWDANVFLALLNEDKPIDEMDGCNAVWTAAQKGRLLIVTSTWINAEVIYMKGSPKLDPKKRPRVNNFFRHPFILQRPLTRQISELARDVVWDTAVKPKDAVHIATSAFHGVEIFHTFDNGLLTIGSIVVNDFTVECRKPTWHFQKEMPFVSPDDKQPG